MKVEYTGLLIENLPSGNQRLRVRVEGKPSKRVRLSVPLDHPDFSEHYHAARRGVKLEAEATPEDMAIRGSFGWLVAKHIAHLEKQVEAGLYSAKTIKKSKQALLKLSDRFHDFKPVMPTKQLIKLRDELIDRPAAADDMIEKVRVMYSWALDNGYVDSNPAIGIKKIYRKGKGATPWVIEEVYKYTKHHAKGSMQHRAITLLLFTACRIEDLTILGPKHIKKMKDPKTKKSIDVLDWQPLKKNAARVTIPILPPLMKAIKDTQTETFITSNRGTVYSSADSLGQSFVSWCKDAGLKNRSAHGIRKAVGSILAEMGCTTYQIMSIHGHTEAQTSEIYTEGAERLKLAMEGMEKMRNIKW